MDLGRTTARRNEKHSSCGFGATYTRGFTVLVYHAWLLLKQWASSTGLTAVSKFKPRLPAQWAVGTHRIGPSRMEKVTSRMNWPIRNSTQIRIRIELVGNTTMWNPSLFFISNRFYKTQNNFGPLNDHIITEFSWVVTMAPAVPSTDILRWPVTSKLPSSRRLKWWRICYIS